MSALNCDGGNKMTAALCNEIIAYMMKNLDTVPFKGGCCDPLREAYLIEEVHAVLQMFVTDDPALAASGLAFLNGSYGCNMDKDLEENK